MALKRAYGYKPKKKKHRLTTLFFKGVGGRCTCKTSMPQEKYVSKSYMILYLITLIFLLVASLLSFPQEESAGFISK